MLRLFSSLCFDGGTQMLIKAELKKVPLCECPKFTKRELSKEKPNYLAAAKICEVSRCGKILVVDYYSVNDKVLQARFFSDAKNYISYVPEDDEWSAQNITSIIKGVTSESKFTLSKSEDYKSVCDYLNVKDDSWGGFWIQCHKYKGIIGACAIFVSKTYEKAREQACERKYERMNKHFSWFPKEYPKSVDKWADNKAFVNTYIFFTNLDKKRNRKGFCGHCGETFKVPADIKHNQITECPKCHKKAVYCADRYRPTKEDKAVICYSFKHENQLCLEWSTAIRRYDEKRKPIIKYDEFARSIYAIEKGKPRIYSYGYQYVRYYWGSYWADWGHTPVYRTAYTFSKNLNCVFGEKYYNVNIKSLVEAEKNPFDFVKLLDRLQDTPQCEYLCKLGLTMLASQLNGSDYEDGKGFAGCLGVNPQYLTLYRDYGVTVSEHRSIKVTKEYVTAEWLARYRTIKACSSYIDVDSLLPYMSVNKLCNYITKQHNLMPKITVGQIAVWLRDYIRMNESLDIKLSKAMLFPKNIKQAHDNIVDRYNKVKAELEDEASRAALSLINEFFKGYEKNGLTVLVPKERSDFIREGQNLNHCVGSDRYYDNHIKGTKMIFFVRKTENPDKSFYTAEIDMFSFVVTQFYGYGDKPAPPQLWSFIREFARWLKTQRGKLRKAG